MSTMADSPRGQRSTHAVTGGSVRFQQPKSSRGHNPRVIIVPEVHPVSGFLDFLREHTVVSLAVGFAIATQAQTVIKQLIASFIDPLYGLLFSQKLSAKVVTLHFHGRAQAFAWGAFVYTFIDFLFVLGAIYFIIKSLKLDKLDKPLVSAEKPSGKQQPELSHKVRPEKIVSKKLEDDGEEDFVQRRLEEEAHT